MPRHETRDTLDRALGHAIRSRRRVLGVSQAALADVLGISFQQVQKYERGVDRVSFSRLVAIAQALDCRVADLVGDLDALDGPAPPLDGAPFGQAYARELLAAFAAAPPHIRRAALRLMLEVARDHSDGRPGPDPGPSLH